MKFVVSIEHPAFAYQFRDIINELKRRGHEVKVLAVKKDIDLELLDKFGIEYETVIHTTGKGIIQKAWLLFITTVNMIRHCQGYNADCFFGMASPMLAMTARWYRKPHVIFEDTEHSYISLFFCKRLSTLILTSESFRDDLGKRQRRLPVYKELFYLHPNRFTPDTRVLKEIGLKVGDCYIIMRFVAWTAEHDIGRKGLTFQTKLDAIKSFEKFGKVLITAEEKLPAELEPYRIRLSPEKIHHVLYYATILFGESSTMASECAVLGTHAIFCDYAGRGYTDEQEHRFGLVYNFKLDESSQKASVKKGIELLQNPDLWRQGKQKRERLLKELRDGTELFLEQLGTIVKL